MRNLASKLTIVSLLGSLVFTRTAAATALVDLTNGLLTYTAVNVALPIVRNALTLGG